jgi:hypothetical protein
MNGNDDDGVPFAEKIYAVFPGFEPSLADGSRGVHLLFLFDPSIGRDTYLRAFQTVMGGTVPWDGNTLRMSPRSAKDVFESLVHLRKEEKCRWDWMCIAPHAFDNAKGLFALKSQMLENFPHEYISALELGDNSLPENELINRPWMQPSMDRYHHAFVHSSDAYSIAASSTVGDREIGSRFTMMKLAKPTVEALRQAMLARDSRLRLAYTKDPNGKFGLRSDLPDPIAAKRPWLQSVTVAGGTSFFAGTDPKTSTARSQTFLFSPDLTVIIGGRMSGKSTLLDGLRVYFGRPMPREEQVKSDVTARANQRFQSGNPNITPVVRGPISTSEPITVRWPAEFFTQRELQQAVRDQKGLRKILYHLAPESTDLLLNGESQLADLDSKLGTLARNIEAKRGKLAEAEQSLATAKNAKQTLDTFKQVGANELTIAQQDTGLLASARTALRELQKSSADLAKRTRDFALPTLTNPTVAAITSDPGLRATMRRFQSAARLARILGFRIDRELDRARVLAEHHEAKTKQDVQDALVNAGKSAEDLNRFDDLTRLAAGFETAASTFLNQRSAIRGMLREFATLDGQRSGVIEQHRVEMTKLASAVARKFGGTIQLSQITDGIQDGLQNWLLAFKEKGITRWWNDLGPSRALVSPGLILKLLRSNKLEQLGMSTQVASRFRECLTASRRLELHALRNEDYYELQMKVADNPPTYKRMEELSGGAQVSLLLTLLLSSENTCPLVIDQPEDELDKSYLRDTVLPALRNLKGHRQIILATHDANIVVNGDADEVIYLRATHDHASIAEQDAIENSKIKNAIIELLDGGSKAFELRKEKYGF